ncbi:Oidioi.mRNA.OKI2018_I69.XSR.g13623.t1.cds [Oikopleura dioica]|uniref:Oidioi.mRNA.OKI2018_I69.XSR.g13623.t1.cds n=1 Tax=Oikopleura dioica TaxID=34765 RepID=A0ABN7S7F0_OIKDI|nr:Oidioi.mRNA.OKI2018_I69.XSR.g13623.t1.cds [Oikopleura dioica]
MTPGEDPTKNLVHISGSGGAPRTINTESRENYTQLTLDGRIKESHTRYGCNKKKHIPARGAVPGRVPAQPLVHATQPTIEPTPMYQTQFCGVGESKTLSKIY